jgi:predicted DCC family thiol-disulfide oxidoreductase YuxK
VTAYPITVYYDASCELCRAEIDAMKSRDDADRLQLIDASAAGFVPPDGVTRHDLMSRIHARDANGAWLRGVDVFAAVYEAAGFRRLARIYRSRALRPLLDRMYPWIADHRQALSALGLARVFGIARRPACPSCAGVSPHSKV